MVARLAFVTGRGALDLLSGPNTPVQPGGGGTVALSRDVQSYAVADPIPIADMRNFVGLPSSSTYGGTSNVQWTSVQSITDGPLGGTTKVIQQSFPYNGGTNYAASPTGTGITLTSVPLIGGPVEEAKIGFHFRVKTVVPSSVPPFGWGFKIPGLGGVGQGRTSVPTGGSPSVYGFSCRLMGRRIGTEAQANMDAYLRGYFYAPWQQAGAIGVDLVTSQNLHANTWHYIEQYHLMNTVTTEGSTNPPADGIHRIWLDGVLVYEATNVVYRFYSDAMVTHFCYDNFYGGSDAADGLPWGPRADSVHQFDNLVIRTGAGSGS